MNKVVHFEVPADDMGRTQRFYEEVFGWHTISMPEMHYTMAHTGSPAPAFLLVDDNVTAAA